jgi:hypothetical protein
MKHKARTRRGVSREAKRVRMMARKDFSCAFIDMVDFLHIAGVLECSDWI